MPRLSALRIGALEELSGQLRFAPRARLLGQLERLRELAPEIDPDRNYPEDWVVFRITGYRPDLQNPSTFVGAALLGDLSSLAERLSAHAALTPDDVEGESLRVEDLQNRWSVSRRTLERYRRQGLIALRVRETGGRVHLRFPVAVVESFERRRTASLDKARGFTRTPDAQERRLVRTARRCRLRYGWTLNETAARLARRSGRAHETVRQILLRHDGEEGSPIIQEGGPLTAHERRVIFRAARAGVSIAKIAERYGRSRASVHRVVNERRAELLRRLELPTDPAPGADEAALELDVVRTGLGESAEQTLESFLQLAAMAPIPNRFVEHALARAQRALLATTGAGVGALSRHNPRAADLDRAETNLRWVALLRAELVRMQRRHALQAIESALGRPLAELSPDDARRAHAMAMDAIIHAATAFDPARGGRLAASAGLAINRALAPLRKSPTPPGAARATPSSIVLTDWTRRLAPWQAWLDPDPRLRRRLDRLDSLARTVIERRYGWAGAPPKTAQELAAALAITPIRVVSIERAALRSVRAGADRS
ncbi:MAG: hypothetical protein EA376_06535 [Phycisphaeraceae bacterium]|nr:MAG: hypothetical protein EA376_06535 [Phycisphaeraceae bacterium]